MSNLKYYNVMYIYTTPLKRKIGRVKFGSSRREAISAFAAAEMRIKEQITAANSDDPYEILHVEDVGDLCPGPTKHDELSQLRQLEQGWCHTRLKKESKWVPSLNSKSEWFYDIGGDVNQIKDDCISLINAKRYGVARPDNFALRGEQQECHNHAIQYFSNDGHDFLVNAKMRFGKTFTSYKIAQSLKAKRVLIMTYKPSVEHSWRGDLNEHVDFDGWDFKSAKTDFSKDDPIVLDSTSDVEVLFTSFQDFNDFDKPKWKNAKSYHYDLIIIDEMHYGTNTDRASYSLEQLSYGKILQLSGTPIKTLMSGKYLPDQIYTWSYADEQKKRKEEELGGWKTEIYRWLPKMHTRMYEVCDAAKRSLEAYDDDEAFSMTKMWGTGKDRAFNDPASVNLFLDQLYGGGTVRKSQSPFRMKFEKEGESLDHTLWILPSATASVDAACVALENHSGFRNYKIINVSGNNVKDIEKVEQIITQAEIDGDHTITVSCGRFNTGVTVPPWNAVFMLDDGKSPETYYQTIFRCQSPYQSTRKENCYVFDFNPQRMLSVVYEYAAIVANDEEKSAEEALREYLEFAPIMDHTGNKPVEVDTNQILDMISETGEFIQQFANASMFCTGVIDTTIIEMLTDIDSIKAVKKSKILSDNGMSGGKNYNSDGTRDTDTEKKVKNLIAEIRKKAQSVTQRIPNYLDLTTNENSYFDIVSNGDENLFHKITGVTITELKYLVEARFIIVKRLNNCIMAFRQSEVDVMQHIQKRIDKRKITISALYSSLTETPTPILLIDDMLDRLPNEVWRNPHLRWLDPWAGRGTFLLCIFERLMRGLTTISDSNERAKYIIENMLYGCDIAYIQYRHMRKTMLYLLNNKNIKLNIFNTNCLIEEWDNMKFDIIIGNPPYSAPKIEDNENRQGGSGNGSVYDTHVEYCLSLKPSYAMFITPAAWATTPGFTKYRELLCNNGLKHIELCGQPFNNVKVPSDVTYTYIEQGYKGLVSVHNKLDNISFDIDLKTFGFLPRYSPEIVEKLMKHASMQGIIKRGKITTILNKIPHNYVYPVTLSPVRTSTHVNKMVSRLRPTQPQSEILYTTIKCDSLQKYKIAFHEITQVGKLGCIKIIEDGTSVSSKLFYIQAQDEDTAKRISHYLNSNLIKFLIKSTKVTINNSKTLFNYIPIMDFSKTYTDCELYEHFQLTPDEINIIESVIEK